MSGSKSLSFQTSGRVTTSIDAGGEMIMEGCEGTDPKPRLSRVPLLTSHKNNPQCWKLVELDLPPL